MQDRVYTYLPLVAEKCSDFFPNGNFWNAMIAQNKAREGTKTKIKWEKQKWKFLFSLLQLAGFDD